jgi:hypothetical protein
MLSNMQVDHPIIFSLLFEEVLHLLGGNSIKTRGVVVERQC